MNEVTVLFILIEVLVAILWWQTGALNRPLMFYFTNYSDRQGEHGFTLTKAIVLQGVLFTLLLFAPVVGFVLSFDVSQ